MSDKYTYKILFIEDEKPIRDNYVAYLKHFFEDVYEAEDGLEGLRVYKEKRPDILIVDIHMPNMNGLEFLAKVRENDHQSKAIMLTAYTDKDFLLQASELKLTKYLVKPINREELKTALRFCIDEIQNYRVESNNIVLLKNRYRWDIKNETLHNNNTFVELSAKERAVLKLLISNSQKIFTYEDISNSAWEYEKDGSSDAIKTILKKLRKKLPENTIENIFGVGYRIKL